MRIRLFLTFLLMWFGNPYLMSRVNEIVFRHITTQEGLSSNIVYSFIEDDFGFIWIGTRNGLNRFDGSQFRIYDQFTGGLKSSHINAIYIDVFGRLWIGTYNGGIALYDQNRDIFISHILDPVDTKALSKNNVQAITGDSQGNIWFGTNGGGLYLCKRSGDSLMMVQPDIVEPHDFSISRIKCLLLENDSTLWIGSYDGLVRYNLNSGKMQVVLKRETDLRTRPQVLLDYSEEVIYVATDGEGIIELNKKSGDFTFINSDNSALPDNLIRDLKLNEDGDILIGSDGGGLIIMDPDSYKMSVNQMDVNDANTLSNNSVYTVFLDRHNNMWIGNYAGGINFYSKYDRKFLPVRHEVNNPNSLSENNVRTIFLDSRDQLWIGTKGGLNLFKPETGQFRIFITDKDSRKSSLSSNTIMSLMDDGRGNLWVGTFSGGINILDLDTYEIRKFDHPDDKNGSLQQSHIYDMVLTRNDVIWIASMGGLYGYDLKKDTLKRYQTGDSNLLDNGVKVLYEDSKGRLWIGTNNGLNALFHGDEVFRTYQSSANDLNSLTNNRIISIFENDDGKLWIGTEGGGINILDPETNELEFLSTADGLPDNVINCVIKDHHGHYWITTNKGLVDYYPNEDHLRVFTEADGLQGNEFYPNTGLITSDRKIYIGGPEGLNTFYPDSLVSNISRPHLLLTDLYLYNKPAIIGENQSPLSKQLFLQESIVLKHKQNNVSIHFSVIGFINARKSKYSTFLEGFDKDWSEYSDNRSATFTNLDPGKYVFRVKAVNSEGLESGEPASLNIRVKPPPWKTAVAYVIYGVLLIVLLLLFRANTIRWINVRNELEMQRREKKHTEELNQMKLRFFTNVSHEFRTPLTLIRGHLHKLLTQSDEKKREDATRIIGQNVNRLLRLITELLDFRKAESGLASLAAEHLNIVEFLQNIKSNYNDVADNRNIRFRFHVPASVPNVWFDPAKIEKVMFNLLSNAFKFTDDGGEIDISIVLKDPTQALNIQDDVRQVEPLKSESDFVQIRVRNTGEGISDEDIDLVFERFYQAEKLLEGKHYQIQRGSGIGLAYSKKLVELHHGRISVKSNLDVETVFTVELPVGDSHLSKEEKAKEHPQGYTLKIDSEDINNELMTRIHDSGIQIELSKPTILVVEDNPSVVDLIRDQLEQEFNIVPAGNGEEGLQMAVKYAPELVITDLMMPVMNGIELTKELKSNIATSHIPVILLTARTDEESQIEGMEIGVDAYINKPYNPDLLKVSVKKMIESRQLLKRKFSGFSTLVPAEVTNNRLDEKFLDKLIGVVEELTGESALDVVSVSREMGMSRSVLYRKIKSISGYTIQEFVKVCKLKKAANALINGNMSIAEIAYSSGFSNSKHFSTSFRKHFGVTPTEFRKDPPLTENR